MCMHTTSLYLICQEVGRRLRAGGPSTADSYTGGFRNWGLEKTSFSRGHRETCAHREGTSAASGSVRRLVQFTHYTMLCFAILYYAMLYYTILCYTILPYYTILYYDILSYPILSYPILYYTGPVHPLAPLLALAEHLQLRLVDLAGIWYSIA